MPKYIVIGRDKNNICHGWRHQRQDMFCIISIANTRNLTAVFPNKVCIPPRHSQTAFVPKSDKNIFVPTNSLLDLNRSVLSKGMIIVDNTSAYKDAICVTYIPHYSSWTYFFDLCKKNKHLKYGMYKIKSQVYKPQHIIDKAKIIANTIKPYIGIHVRRGDKVTNKRFDDATRPENIINKIKKIAKNYTNIYIATNEFSVNFFDPIKHLYNVFLISDFSNVVADIMDNPYAILEVEEEILHMGYAMVSTIKEENSTIHLLDS